MSDHRRRAPGTGGLRRLPGLGRARTQAGLLAAVAALVLLAATSAGAAAQLLTVGQDVALSAALATAPVSDVRATARLDLPADGGADQQELLERAASALAGAATPATSRSWTAWTTSARYLDPAATAPSAARDLRQGTLALLGTVDGAGGEGLADHAVLVDGRWPLSTGAGGAVEVAAPVGGATGALALGSRAVLATAPGDDPAARAAEVVVVGTYSARTADPVWRLDPLRGAGTGAGVEVPGTSGRVRLPAVGPLLAAPGLLARGGVLAAEGGAVAVPQLADLTPAEARAVAAPRAGAADAVERGLAEGRAAGTGEGGAPVVDAALPRLLQRVAAEQRATAAGVLVGAVVVGVVAALALAAAGQLLAARRRPERDLLALRGASPRQLLGRDAAESGALALVAALAALPASTGVAALLLRQALTVPPSTSAALTAGAGGAAAVLAVAGTALLAVVVVLAAGGLRSAQPGRPGAVRHSGRGVLARSGADVLLVGVAAAAWWQLHSAAADGPGALLVAVPALALLATALLGVRATTAARRSAERLAARTDAAPRAVAAWALAREPLAAGTAALLVLASATAVTSLLWRGAWSESVGRQVSAQVGSDLVVEPTAADDGTAAPATAAALASATGGDPAPVSEAPVALGTRVGVGSVQLVAVPAARAAELLRAGPPPEQVQELGTAPEEAAGSAPVLPAGSGPLRLRVTGAGAADGPLAGRVRVPQLQVRPALVVRDGWGATAVLEGSAVPLDGAPHDVSLEAPDRPAPTARGALRVVGLRLTVLPPAPDGAGDAGGADDASGAAGDLDQRLDVTLTLPAAGAPIPGAQRWSPSVDTGGAVREAVVDLTAGGAGSGSAELQATVLVSPSALSSTGAQARALAQPAPEQLPVLVSSELAAQVGAAPGQLLALGLSGQQLTARVVGVVPVVPAAPGEPAVLVDSAGLDATLLAVGAVPTAQRWWVGGLSPAAQQSAARAVQDAGLGSAVVRSVAVAEARRDPLTAGLRAAWLLLLTAAGAAALAGSALVVAAAGPADAATAARLAVLGVPPRERARAVLAPRAAQVLLGALAGALLGTGAAAVVVPELLRAPDGSRAVPGTGVLQALSSLLAGSGALQLAAVLGALVVLAVLPLAAGAAAARRREGGLR